MNETPNEVRHDERTIQQTSEETGWQTPGYVIVETALEVTAYSLGNR